MAPNAATVKKPEWVPPSRCTYGPRRSPTEGMTPGQKTGYFIELQVQQLEEERKKLKWDEKWPTVTSVQRHRESLAKVKTDEPAKPKPPQPSPITSSSRRNSDTPSSPQSSEPPSVSFPFPATKYKGLSEFTLFPLLATELRLLIWQFAILSPRFIELQYHYHSGRPTFRNHRKSSPFLFVSHESHELYLSLMSKNRASNKISLPTNHLHAAPCSTLFPHYITYKPKHDTIFLRSLHVIPQEIYGIRYSIPTLMHIQHLALPFPRSTPLKTGTPKTLILPTRRGFQDILSAFPSLRTLTFMLGCEEKAWNGEKSIELRDLETWFVDGRSRRVGEVWGNRKVDVADVARVMEGWAVEESKVRTVRVRVVAWKREK